MSRQEYLYNQVVSKLQSESKYFPLAMPTEQVFEESKKAVINDLLKMIAIANNTEYNHFYPYLTRR